MTPTHEQMRQELVELNKRITEMEQRRDLAALEFFNLHLADQLVLRRANGTVVGKYGQQGFMRSLSMPSRFCEMRTEDIEVELLDARALVTLEVVASSRSDAAAHRFCHIRMFSQVAGCWLLDLWYDYEIAMPRLTGRSATVHQLRVS